MIEGKDWLSLLIGIVLTAAGTMPMLSGFGVGPEWFSLPWMPVQIFAYIVAIAGFYLMIESVIEITNSNSIGWLSFLVAGVLMAVGILQVLSRFAIGPEWFSLSFISQTIYYVIFVIEGLFLMIAMFAMEM